MLDRKDAHTRTGTLIYNSDWNCFELDGYELQHGDQVELSVFGTWLPGDVALDSTGWCVFTPDQVAIRLHTGLPARLGVPRVSGAPLVSSLQEGEPARVLLVDDDTALLQALSHALSLRISGVNVETAPSALEALQLIQEHRYDAIVSDIKMPGMDGLELLARIQDLRPETPTLLITGHGEHDLAVRALRGGAYDYIQKPIDRDAFLASLRRAIDTHQLRRQVAEQQALMQQHARSLERVVQQRTADLVEASATKGKMISTLTHDLKASLHHLKNGLHDLHRQFEGTDRAVSISEPLSDMEHAIQQTEALLQEVLDVSRIETTIFVLHRQRCNLVDVCRQVLEERLHAGNPSLTIDPPDAHMEVEVDVERISQVLLSLLSPAHTSSALNSSLTMVLQQVGEKAIISIQEQERASSAELLSALFEHSSPLLDSAVEHDVRTRFGLGLYMARKVVERHGGRLEVQNIPGQGRTFSLVLPLAVAPPMEKRKAPSLVAREPSPFQPPAWLVS